MCVCVCVCFFFWKNKECTDETFCVKCWNDTGSKIDCRKHIHYKELGNVLLNQAIAPGVTSIDTQERACRLFAGRPCLGYQLLPDPTFHWILFSTVRKRFTRFAAGLRSLGYDLLSPEGFWFANLLLIDRLKPGTFVTICSENRPEWYQQVCIEFTVNLLIMAGTLLILLVCEPGWLQSPCIPILIKPISNLCMFFSLFLSLSFSLSLFLSLSLSLFLSLLALIKLFISD